MPKKRPTRFASFSETASPDYPAPEGPSPGRRRTRVLSDKLPFSSRISPVAADKLAKLVERTGRPVTHLLDEALTDLFVKHKKTPA